MTPQGLSDAIDDLVADLPGQKERISGSWQKVLTMQALTTVLGGHWYDDDMSHQLHEACAQASTAVRDALKLLYRDRPALHQAIVTAFNLPEWHADSETAFAKTALAQQVWYPADLVRTGEGDAA